MHYLVDERIGNDEDGGYDALKLKFQGVEGWKNDFVDWNGTIKLIDYELVKVHDVQARIHIPHCTC